MKVDPIEEIRERRRRLVQEKYHGSVDELLAAGMKWEKEHPDRVVDLRKGRTRRRQKVAG